MIAAGFHFSTFAAMILVTVTKIVYKITYFQSRNTVCVISVAALDLVFTIPFFSCTFEEVS